jgi:hypothetical protein
MHATGLTVGTGSVRSCLPTKSIVHEREIASLFWGWALFWEQRSRWNFQRLLPGLQAQPALACSLHALPSRQSAAAPITVNSIGSSVQPAQHAFEEKM